MGTLFSFNFIQKQTMSKEESKKDAKTKTKTETSDNDENFDEKPKAKPTATKKRTVDDSAAYGKTIPGRLKLKGVDIGPR